MKQFLFLLVFATMLAACNQDKPSTAATTPAPAAAPAATLPSVPLDLLEKIWQEGTQVDFIFYNYSFTMSLTEKSGVQHAVRHLAEKPAPLLPECKATGRVSFQIKGEIVLDGDFFFAAGCTYFVFEKNRVKTYANYMTDDAIQYFNAQIQQAVQMQQKMQGGQ